MIIREGEKVHVVSRRMFPSDVRRHFAGTVDVVGEVAIRVTGHTFIYHSESGRFEKRPKLRTRIFSLTDAGLVISILPDDTDIARIKYSIKNGRLTVEDGKTFQYDLSEYAVD